MMTMALFKMKIAETRTPRAGWSSAVWRAIMAWRSPMYKEQMFTRPNTERPREEGHPGTVTTVHSQFGLRMLLWSSEISQTAVTLNGIPTE